MTETCVNCGRRINWGKAFPKHPDKIRKCYWCKEDFDRKKPNDKFNLVGFIT